MDAKDLRTEAVLGDRSNDGNAKYAQGSATLPCSRTKPYQDIGSNSLGKVDVQTARPCAVIGPDRVVPPAASSDAYLKKGPVEPWLTTDNSYRRPPDYPHKVLDYQHPARNISPRQTYQENMQRIMVPPSYNSVKLKEDHNFPVDTNIPPMRNNKFNIPPDSKYCEVPYAVNNTMTNEQKTVRNPDISVPNMNPLARGVPHVWPPNSANIRPTKPYGTPELYQYPEYPSCAGPRPMLMPRPHRAMHEEAGHMYPDPYYQEGNIRFKPYPAVKERFPQPRYDYIANYSNPFHPPPPFPTHKYELQKPVHPHPYPGYPQVPIKYLDSRIPEPIMNGYQRPNPQTHFSNVPFRNQVIHPTYGPVAGNCLQTNKYFPFPPESSAKPNTSNKLPYDPNNKIYSEGFYVNDLARTHSMKGQVLPPNYPGNVYGMPPHPYYRRENPTLKGYEFGPHVRNIDPSMTMNGPPISRFQSQYSPSTIAISPSDSNTSNDTNQTQGTSHEDCGYVSQSSSVSIRSMDSGINRMPYDIYRRYDQRYNSAVKSSLIPKYEDNSHAGSKDKKDIDVRQFLQMWNEGEDENGDNVNSVNTLTNAKDINKAYEANNQEQLYVLGLVNVPSEELGKYEHIQKVSKLPENIKGYNSIELLHQFEEVIESSNLNNYNSKPPTPRTFDTSLKRPSAASLHGLGIPPRPISPLDVEAKISQSVIHKEVGCNFEIKPCSPKMMNVEIAAPVQSVLGERVIEKVTNSLIVNSPILNNANENILKCQEQRMNENISSCKMIKTQFSGSEHNGSVKTNYSLQDLESNSGVCLASLPRLDNDIELNFPEVNQQFINANKVESVITTTTKDLPDLDVDHLEAKDQVVQETDQCLTKPDVEKDLSKLSKYRKFKRKGSEPKEVISETNVQALRTDSVIIKNPENVKNQEESIIDSPKMNTNNAQQDPINLTVTPDSRTIEQSDVKDKDSILNKTSDLAIDFSLNSSEHYNDKNDSRIFKMNTNLRQDEENKDYTFNEDCSERPKSPFHSSFSDILQDSKAPEYENPCKMDTDENSHVDYDVFATEQTNVSDEPDRRTSSASISRFNTGNESLRSTNDEFHYNNVAKDQETNITEDLQLISAASSNNMICNKTYTNSLKLSKNIAYHSEMTPTDFEINQQIKDLCDNRNDSIVNNKSEEPEEKQPNELVKESREFLDDRLNSKMSRNEGIVCKIKVKAPKSDKRRKKKKSHKIKTSKIHLSEELQMHKSDCLPIVSIQTGENKETTKINNFAHIPEDSREAHVSNVHKEGEKSTRIDTLVLSKWPCTKQQEFSSLVNTLEESQEMVNSIKEAQEMDVSPYTPEESQENKIIPSIHNESEGIHVAPTISKESPEVRKPNSVQEELKQMETPLCTETSQNQYDYVSKESPLVENSFVPMKSPKVNESIYVADRLEDSLETHKPIADREKSQGEDSIHPDVLKQSRDCKWICVPEEPSENEELISGINYCSEKTKNTDEPVNRKVYSREVTKNEQGNHTKCKINKELFSPRIQKLILQEEGFCLNELETVRNLDAMAIKASSKITRQDEIWNSGSSDPEISSSEIFDNQLKDERCESSQNSELKTIEDSPANILESVKKKPSKFDSINLMMNTESNSKVLSLNLLKDDSDNYSRHNCLNKIEQSNDSDENMNLDINELPEKHDIPSLDTELTEISKTIDSPKTGVDISQLNDTCIDSEFDKDIFATRGTDHTLTDDNYTEKSPDTIKDNIPQIIYSNVESCLTLNSCDETLCNAEKETQIENELSLHHKDSMATNTIGDQATYTNSDSAETNVSILYVKDKTDEGQSLEKLNTQCFDRFSSKLSKNELSANLPASEEIELDNSFTHIQTDEFITSSPEMDIDMGNRTSIQVMSPGQSNNEENTIQQQCDIDSRDKNIDGDQSTNDCLIETDNVHNYADGFISNQSPHDLQGEMNEHSPTNGFHCINERFENMINEQDIAVSRGNESRINICTDSLQDVIQTNNYERDQNKNMHYSSNYRYKKKKSLKRSLSESALDDICDNTFEGSDNKPLLWSNKRQKFDDTDNVADSHFVSESYCNLIQQNRRNSVSSIYNEDNVSFCILIENNCIIAGEGEETEKICFAEIPEGCLPCIEDSSENMISEADEMVEETSEEIVFQDDREIVCSPSAESCEHGDKTLEDAWVDDVAYVETVVSEDVAEDIIISASTSPKNDSDDDEEFNDDVDIYGDHTDKVKYIYGDKMCSDDAHLVETLYRTPQMDVNKTLVNRESLFMEECNRYYDKESLEKVLSDSIHDDIVPEIVDETHNSKSPISGYSTSTTSKTVHDCKEFHNIENCSRDNFNNNGHGQIVERKDIEEIPKIPIEQMQDHTIHSCESSLDNVLSYIQREESPKRTISSSPEVSSTTSEEKNSSILLKITNYNGSRISEINNINSGNRISCKYTEDKDYISSHNNLPARPLITKAAQKYIPPLKETIRDLKIQLPLPQKSLLKLKQLKVAKEKPKSIPKTSNTVCRKEIPKKPKPKFEDVLKSIDEIQVQKHKESKKIKKAVPKVVIKKNENGSHYASTSNPKDKYNPDLTGRKWQPWVFIERNNFIDKMALKKKTRAVFSYRKNEYVFAEKFRKYRSVSSAKFVISQPKLNDSISGQLKYTIKLKHAY